MQQASFGEQAEGADPDLGPYQGEWGRASNKYTFHNVSQLGLANCGFARFCKSKMHIRILAIIIDAIFSKYVFAKFASFVW